MTVRLATSAMDVGELLAHRSYSGLYFNLPKGQVKAKRKQSGAPARRSAIGKEV